MQSCERCKIAKGMRYMEMQDYLDIKGDVSKTECGGVVCSSWLPVYIKMTSFEEFKADMGNEYMKKVK